MTEQTPRRKALNTFCQGLAVAIATAIVVTLLTAVGSASSWAEFGGIIVAWSTFQAVATAALTWIMRGYIDSRRGDGQEG